METPRVPPHDILVEKAILGMMMLNPKIIPKVKHLISLGDFYREAHQNIFNATIESGGDVPMIISQLKKKDLLEKAGGPDYVVYLVNDVGTSAGVESLCRNLKELSNRRKLISACYNTATNSFELSNETEDIFSDLKSELREIQADQSTYYTENKDLIQFVFKDIERRIESDDPYMGPISGFQNIDTHLYGFELKTLTYLIARPSQGKTALALNIADNMALNGSGKVVFFSLEMGDEALTRRRISCHSEVYLSRIRAGHIQESQWRDLIEAADILSDSSLIIIDKPKYKVIENLTSLSETLALEHPLSAIFVDHIQLMRSRKKFSGRHHEISYISNELKSLAKELNVPLIVLCQLSRAIESRTDRRPRLSDMKESGDLEQDADVVISLYRHDTEQSEICEIGCLKGRDIGTWRTTLKFDRYIQKFYDTDEEPEQCYSPQNDWRDNL